MVGLPPGGPFRAPKNHIGRAPLERTKTRAMDGVDHEGNPGMAGSEPSHDARLAAVGMNDPGACATEVTAKPQVGQSIHHRMDRPDEAGFQMQESGHRPGDGFEGSFRSTGRTRNQFDLPIRNPSQAKNRAEGVLLSPANNQPGDDMAHTHGLDRSNCRGSQRCRWPLDQRESFRAAKRLMTLVDSAESFGANSR